MLAILCMDLVFTLVCKCTEDRLRCLEYFAAVRISMHITNDRCLYIQNVGVSTNSIDMYVYINKVSKRLYNKKKSLYKKNLHIYKTYIYIYIQIVKIIL